MKGVPEPISPLSCDRRVRVAAYIGVLAAYLAAASEAIEWLERAAPA